MSRLVYLGCFAYLMVGLALLVIGAVMEPMVNAYGIGYGDGGQLVMHQFLGGMAGVLCAPRLIKRFGKKPLLLTVLALIAIVQGIYALEPAWWVMLTVAPITGLGFGVTEATIGTFVISAAAGNANRAMTRIEVFFGVGALLMPFLGALFISAGVWRLSFVVVSVLAAATFLLWLIFWPKILDRVEVHDPAAEEVTRASGAYAGRIRMTLFACILFFLVYVGFEMSFIHYLPSIMVQNNGLAESTASLSISLYWLTMVVGRLVAGHAADRWGGASYLVAMCAANAVIFLLMIGMDGVTSTFMLAAASGLAMSGMFSIALVFANRALPGKTVRTTSILMASGGIGGALLPKLTGWFLDVFGPDETRWLFGAFGIVLLIVMVCAVAAASKHQRRDVMAASKA